MMSFINLVDSKPFEKQIQLGTVSREEATLTQNQIRVGLLELIGEIEIQQEQNPSIKKEWDNAVSILNSKNTINNSTITAGRDVHTGDRTITNITNIIEPKNKLPKHLTSNFPKINPDNFVGRKETLKQLHQLLQDDKKNTSPQWIRWHRKNIRRPNVLPSSQKQLRSFRMVKPSG